MIIVFNLPPDVVKKSFSTLAAHVSNSAYAL